MTPRSSRRSATICRCMQLKAGAPVYLRYQTGTSTYVVSTTARARRHGDARRLHVAGYLGPAFHGLEKFVLWSTPVFSVYNGRFSDASNLHAANSVNSTGSRELNVKMVMYGPYENRFRRHCVCIPGTRAQFLRVSPNNGGGVVDGMLHGVLGARC